MDMRLDTFKQTKRLYEARPRLFEVSAKSLLADFLNMDPDTFARNLKKLRVGGVRFLPSDYRYLWIKIHSLGSSRGELFFADNFKNLATPENIRLPLFRLESDGLIERLNKPQLFITYEG
ncbi:hypothetical protein [Pedobacter faecalis]|uniref:hypothetical protein n=1 Tax=Pedobacter faecalis TaxID=3041495 RepID=UPI002551A186|nr:hypothetical protein [Pedobacter sp. ELA7]